MVSYQLLVVFVCNQCIEGVHSWYSLFDGNRKSAGEKCSKLGGNITTFRDYSSRELNKILEENSLTKIWNGYSYTTGFVKNAGCFKKISPYSGYGISVSDMTISYCAYYCKNFGQDDFAIQTSKCLCVTGSMGSTIFNLSSAHNCQNRCIKQADEYCGSSEDLPFYNIYSVINLPSMNYPSVSGNGLCLFYERKNFTSESLSAFDCNSSRTSSFVVCRLINNSVVKINKTLRWTEYLNTCVCEKESYPASYLDVKSVVHPNGAIWLNERKYTTVVEQMHDREPLEICEIVSKDMNGTLIQRRRKCTAVDELKYICKTDHLDEDKTTSTLPHSNGRKSSSTVATSTKRSSDGMTNTDWRTSTFNPQQNGSTEMRHTPTETMESGDDHLDEDKTTSTLPHSICRKSSSTVATSTKRSSDGITNTDWRTSTFNPLQNGSTEMRHTLTETMESGDVSGSIIGGVIGTLVVLLITGGVVIFILRKRQQESCKDDYQSQKVNYSKCNGLTNMAYCSEATLNIIQGNPDRISQEYTTIKDEFRNSQEYTTIQDEKLQNIRVSNSESDTFENKNHSSPTNGPLYMVLEETHSKSEIKDPSNYELAQPICDKEENENASLQTEGREQKEEAMDYDHLRQEAYKQNMAEENVYNHAETDNDYSHISQVTKTNKNHIDDDDDDNDYDHTGNVQNHELTSNTGNDQDDTCTYAHAGGDGRTVDDQTDDDDDDDYAHTQTKENHHQTSIMRIDQDGTTADGMRDIGPYDLAQNVRRPDDDSKEYSDNIRGIGSYEVVHNVNRPDVDDQESSNDMREIGPYEFAHNIDRRENGTTESTQGTFVQLGTEEGNYSLAEPIDMDNNGQYW